MPNDADRAGMPAGVFSAELRFHRPRVALCQKNLYGCFQEWADIDDIIGAK